MYAHYFKLAADLLDKVSEEYANSFADYEMPDTLDNRLVAQEAEAWAGYDEITAKDGKIYVTDHQLMGFLASKIRELVGDAAATPPGNERSGEGREEG